MVVRASQFKAPLKALLPSLIEEYDVDSIGVFGSYVRGEQRPDSDLDILVSFKKTPSLLKFIELEDLLTQKLGIRVDLVSRKALRKRIGDRILDEVIPL